MEASKGTMMIIFILFLSLLTSAPTPSPPPFPSQYPQTGDVNFLIRSTVTFINQGMRVWNITKEDRMISLFMNNTWQTVHLTYHSYPLEATTVDENGNPLGVLQFQSQLKPGENITYSVTYHVVSKSRTISDLNETDSETLEDIPQSLQEIYCGAEGPWLANNTDLQQLAWTIVGQELRVLTIVKKFIAWIWKNIQYPGEPHEVPQYPDQTLATKEGDCDDQAILLVTLCRILGIPSYLQVGCIYLPTYYVNDTSWDGHVSHVLEQIGWHGWAIVYVPPWGWLPVDLTYVMGSRSDPLNAIRKGAVTSQATIQYMNITKTDYVASAWTYRDLLQENDFCLYTMDEMTIKLFGDLNDDGVVNILDITIVAKSFGSKPGDNNWNVESDLDSNGVINIIDVATVAKEYGKTKQ